MILIKRIFWYCFVPHKYIISLQVYNASTNGLGCFRCAEHSDAISKVEQKYTLAMGDILWLQNFSHKTTHGWNDWHIKFK